MKKKYIVAFVTVLAMGITACSFKPEEDRASVENTAEPENAVESETDTEPITAAEPETATEPEVAEETKADPITGVVEKYADDIIVITDKGDGITYYFSTQNAQVTEGDSPIAVGDVVQVTYKGLLGDEEHPGEAVKIVAGVVE